MSYQIVCDNCGAMAPINPSDSYSRLLPTNWESIALSAAGGKPVQHHCYECAQAKDAARWDIQSKIREAQEAALTARRATATAPDAGAGAK